MKAKYSIMAFGAAALALGSCSNGGEQTVETVEELPIVSVDVAHRIEVPQTKNYTASVEAENINNIAPATPNRIKKINVEVGDHVRAGQELVILDSSNIDQIKINLDQIRRDYDRAVKLLEIGGGTQQTVDQLKAQLDAAQSQYDNMLENTVLRSPISGVVTARNYDPGDMTGSQPVLTVGQLTPVVKVMLNVSENDMALVKQGTPVGVTFDAYPGETFSGTINRIYPTVDTATRTFPVEVRITNQDGRIQPGMFARVNFDLGVKPNVVVPDQAVVKQTGSGNKYVYVYSNGRVSYNKVELGQRLDNAYELLSGVNDGDTVVTNGQSRLADGVAVELLKR
ncbi:MAG: efflux RND transporter periplasmic adaptor subunit [Muribaculaceae bacterium]|nr:efflux RND transporter periplasmic adaptor subunit [Muribaculaceae bacterium]